MSLANVKEEYENSSNDTNGGSQSNSSSSSSSGSSGPRTKERMPYLVVYEWADGQVEIDQYPDTTPITMEYKQGSWGFQEKPAERRKILWSRDEYRMYKDWIQEHVDKDLSRLVEENPAAALKAINYCCAKRDPDKPDLRPRCAVCNEKMDRLEGNWRTIERRAVHESHTVGDLAEAEII